MARQAGEITPATGKIIKQNNSHTMRTKKTTSYTCNDGHFFVFRP